MLITGIIFIKVLFLIFCTSTLGFILNLIARILSKSSIRENISLLNVPIYFILGIGLYTFTGMFFSFLGIKVNIYYLYALIGILYACLLLLLYVKRLKFADILFFKRPVWRPFYLIVIALFVLMLLPLIFNLIMTISFPQYDIDMIGHILMKAKIIASDSYKHSIYINDELFANIHSRYPPYAGIYLGLLINNFNDAIMPYQFLNYLILLFLAASIYTYLKNKVTLAESIIWFFVVISTNAYISSQYIIDSIDVLLSLFLFTAVFYLIEYARDNDSYNIVITSVLTGCCTLIKNEGILFAVIMSVVIIFFNRRAFLKYIIIILVISLPWLIYRNFIPDPAQGPERLLITANIAESAKHIKHTLFVVSNILLNKWNFMFPASVIASLILLKGRFKKEALTYFLFVCVTLCGYVFVIWLHTGKTPFFAAGFFRILSHIYPMVIVISALAVNQLIFDSERI